MYESCSSKKKWSQANVVDDQDGGAASGMGVIIVNLEGGPHDSEKTQTLEREPGEPASDTVAEEDESYGLDEDQIDCEDGDREGSWCIGLA